MPLILLRMVLLKRGGSSFIQAFQGAGPITSKTGRFFLRRIARRIDVSLPREPTARELLITEGGMKSDRVKLAADGAVLMDPPDETFGKEYLRTHNFDPEAPILGLNLRRWFHQKAGWMPTQVTRHREGDTLSGPMEMLVENVAKAIQSLKKAGYSQLAMIPMYRAEPEPWEDDIRLLRAVEERVGDGCRSIMVDEDLSPQQLLSIYSRMTMMVGVRLHSTILAHVGGTPAIHICYEHKGREHFQQMGLDENLISIDDVCGKDGGPALAEKMLTLHKNLENTRSHIKQRMTELRNQTQTVLNEVLATTLERGGSTS